MKGTAWVGSSMAPDAEDVEFQEKHNTISFGLKFGSIRIYLQEDLPFLNRLRYAVDEAIKHNYKKEEKENV